MKKLIALVFGIAVLVAGCATAPKIDWQSRVGNYTYDQAVLDFGPPDKYAKLGDGTQVAEWLTSRGRSSGYSSYIGRGLVYYNDASSPDYYLRLSFDPSGRLQSYKKYAK
ncbi:MAG TPA: hypothetical protein VI282_16920 [Verrucomicrobiae bacterium]|jgi:hypothetical protein